MKNYSSVGNCVMCHSHYRKCRIKKKNACNKYYLHPHTNTCGHPPQWGPSVTQMYLVLFRGLFSYKYTPRLRSLTFLFQEFSHGKIT